MKVLKKISAILDKKGYNRTFRTQVESALQKALSTGEKVLQLIEGKNDKEFVLLVSTDYGILYILPDLWPEPQVRRISYLEINSTKAIIGTELRIHLEIEAGDERYKIATYNLRSTLTFLRTVKEFSTEKTKVQQILGQLM